MTKLKDSPGSQNGTGLLQTVIAMKVSEVYEKLTAQETIPAKETSESGTESLRDLLLR